MNLEFEKIGNDIESCDCYGIRITREWVRKKYDYFVHISPENISMFRSAIEVGILDDNNVRLKISGNCGLYKTSELLIVKNFLKYVLRKTPEVFLEHNGVTVYQVHKYSYDNSTRRPLNLWYTTNPETNDEDFYLCDIGVGSMNGDFSTDLSQGFEIWLQAVRSAIIDLIEKGHIQSGIKPVPVEDSKAKAAEFQKTYNHRGDYHERST